MIDAEIDQAMDEKFGRPEDRRQFKAVSFNDIVKVSARTERQVSP
jgi:hypothetical protein